MPRIKSQSLIRFVAPPFQNANSSLVCILVFFFSRYISRYENLKFEFLPFVVASIVAMVFFSAVFAARAPAMGNSADRAWQLSQLVEGVLTACNPSRGSLSYMQAGHCVSKQIGRHDAACQDCPRVSRSPEAHCFRVVARAVRFSQPAVLSALLAIQLFGIVIPPPYFPKEHQKERCGHSRSQRSFITFHGALRNILLSAGFPAMFHMIVLEQTFVNALLQNFFLLLLLNRIDQ